MGGLEGNFSKFRKFLLPNLFDALSCHVNLGGRHLVPKNHGIPHFDFKKKNNSHPSNQERGQMFVAMLIDVGALERRFANGDSGVSTVEKYQNKKMSFDSCMFPILCLDIYIYICIYIVIFIYTSMYIVLIIYVYVDIPHTKNCYVSLQSTWLFCCTPSGFQEIWLQLTK